MGDPVDMAYEDRISYGYGDVDPLDELDDWYDDPREDDADELDDDDARDGDGDAE